jgi:hypothetical protein
MWLNEQADDSAAQRISSPKWRSIVSHIVWHNPATSETTIGVVGCDSLCPAVNVKVDVKTSYGVSVSL